MKNKEELILKYGTLLLQYRNHLQSNPVQVVTDEIVTSNYLNDPVFNRVIDHLLSIDSSGTTDYLSEPIPENDNIQILDDASISFTYNQKSKALLIRDGRNSIDFYPTTNKWKDNNNNNRMFNGNARKLIQYMDF